MADTQRRVSLIFDADVNRAKQQIENLVSSIEKVMDIGTRSTGITSLDKNLQEAVKDAAQLQIQLQKAVNVKTGKLDLTKFNESLNTSGMTLEKYQQSFSKMGSAGQQAFTNLARSIATAEIPLRRSSKVLDDFAVTMKNTVKWQLSSSLMHGFLSSVQSAMSYAQHLNQNLTNIRIVTGQSADDMARFAEQANRSAKELSTTTNQYAQAALIFYQQGLGDKAVKERTDTVIKMANVTGEAAKDVSSYMTAIWNNFDNGSKSLEYYADVITKLGAATAASSEEIAGGLEKFAAIGNTIGLSYEYATSMITTIVDKTRQSEDVVGTALKTILARIQGLNLGETLEDGTTLNKYSAALASVGVQIKDASGQLRDMDAILNDLGGKWQSLSKDTQVALAQTVGGVRQYNQILALMDNWDAFEMNLDIAFNAEGELDKQAEIYAESWEAAQRRVQAALESIYSSLIDDTFFIKMNSMFADLLGIVKQFIDGVGGVSGLLTGMGSILLTVFGSQITASLKNLTNNIRMLTKTGQEEIVSIQKQAQILLNKQNYGKGAGAQGIKSAYESEARAQLALLNNAKKLTEEEQAIANILMQQHHIRVDEQVALGNQLNELEKVEQRQIGIFNSAKDKLAELMSSENTPEEFEHNFTRMKEVSQNIIDLQNDITALGPAIESAFGSGEGGQSVAAQRLLQDIDKIKLTTPAAKAALADFKNAMNAAGPDTEAQAKAFANLEAALGNLNQRVAEGNETINGLFNNMRQAAQGNENLIRAVNTAEQAYRNYINTSERVQRTKQDLITANGQVIASEKAVQAVLKASGATYLSTQQSIVAVAQMASTLGSFFNTFKGLWESIKEGNVSFGQLLTTFGFLIPQTLSLIGNFKNLTMTTYGAIASGKLFSTAKLAEAAATNVASGAVVGFGTALKTALPFYTAITAAAIVLTGVIAGLYAIMSKPSGLEKHQKQLSELKDSIKALEEEERTINNTINQVYEDFAEYQDAYDALTKLAEGTSLWKEQLVSVKNLSQGLIESWPILQKIIENPEYFGMANSIFNSDGTLTQEVIDLAQKLTLRENSFQGINTAVQSVIKKQASREEAVESAREQMFYSVTPRNPEEYIGNQTKFPEQFAQIFLTGLAAEIGQGKDHTEVTLSSEEILEYIKNKPEYYSDDHYTEEGLEALGQYIGYDYGMVRGGFRYTPGKQEEVDAAVLDALEAFSKTSEYDASAWWPFLYTENLSAGTGAKPMGFDYDNAENIDPAAIDTIFTAAYNAVVEETGKSIYSQVDSETLEALQIPEIDYTDYEAVGNTALFNAGFTSSDLIGQHQMSQILGFTIAKGIDYESKTYSNLSREDFKKLFPGWTGIEYDQENKEMSYVNPEYTGEEGQERRITIPNADKLYAMLLESEQAGERIKGAADKYEAIAYELGLKDDQATAAAKFFQNKGNLESLTIDEVSMILETSLRNIIPGAEEVERNIQVATSEGKEGYGIPSEYSYSIATNAGKISTLPPEIQNIISDSDLSGEDLATIVGLSYEPESLWQTAKILRDIESVNLSHIAQDLEKGLAPAQQYDGLAGNMAEIAEIISAL